MSHEAEIRRQTDAVYRLSCTILQPYADCVCIIKYTCMLYMYAWCRSKKHRSSLLHIMWFSGETYIIDAMRMNGAVDTHVFIPLQGIGWILMHPSMLHELFVLLAEDVKVNFLEGNWHRIDLQQLWYWRFSSLHWMKRRRTFYLRVIFLFGTQHSLEKRHF